MATEDIRWQQRLSNYEKALGQLTDAVRLAEERNLSEIERQGLIQAFEFTHELAWNVMKDYFKYQGNTSLTGSRDVTREAFSQGLIDDGKTWMEMITSRNMAAHTYNEDTATEIVRKVCDNYFKLFIAFREKMHQIIEKG
jgi:nucleotidyltransferase substrate binding protein (TIGR01987 family)